MKSAAVGAITGAAGGAVGRGVGAALGKLATTATGRVVAGAASKAASRTRNALGRGGGAAAGGGKSAGASAARKAGSKVSGGKPKAASAGPRGCPKPNSFVAGTKVELADGTYKVIEKIKAGDKVLSTDPITGKSAPKLVVAAFSGAGYLNVVQITVDTDGRKGDDTGVILATEHHLFWDAKDRQWVRADHLTGADRLRTPSGATARVVGTTVQRNHPAVYDLTVADTHAYYVLAGTAPVLVHNCGTASPWEFERTHSIQGNASSRNVRALTQSMRTDGWQGDPISVVEHDAKLFRRGRAPSHSGGEACRDRRAIQGGGAPVQGLPGYRRSFWKPGLSWALIGFVSD
ncbi:hypothetical protein GCM10020001_112470 [Nonomuraea salmonea]